ncbi:MAG: hypothetical protein JSS49_00005 [Planctomycetes bacterium]|nr:hypothetical protein [Planctomycetota bacterium]
MKQSSGSARSDKPAKPHPDFPLFPHATKRWAKKIRGEFHFFGPWRDPQGALEEWLRVKDDLLAGRKPRDTRDLASEDIRTVLDAADVHLKAMILLGVNAGYGNNDCATLTRAAIDLKNGWLSYARPKTGVSRRAKLWPETVAASKASLKKRPEPHSEDDAEYFFITKYHNSWSKNTTGNPVSLVFRRLLDDCSLHRSGLGFYSLRWSFETVAGETLDQPAVDLVMGHTPLAGDMGGALPTTGRRRSGRGCLRARPQMVVPCEEEGCKVRLGLKLDGPGDKPGSVRLRGGAMREFFKGWRRKVGVMTLVVACAVWGLWLRSKTDVQGPSPFGYPEHIQIGNNRFQSFNGQFEWYHESHVETLVFPASNGEGTTTIAMTEINNPIFVVWYFFIVLSLTLLSAYLILWKPRIRKERTDA